MSQVRQVAHNTIVQSFGKALTISIALIAFGLTTRYLGQTGFGYYTTIYTFLAIFGILIDLGLQMTTTRMISDPNNNESEIISNALTMRLVASIIFLGLAPVIVLLFPYPAIIKVGVSVAVVGFIFASLTSTLTSLFQKYLIMQKVVAAEVTAKILLLLTLIFVINTNLGLTGIVGAVVLDSVITFIILLFLATKVIDIKPKFNLTIWKNILTLTWPIALTIALNLIYFKGDIFIMSLLKSQSEVGLYGAPYRVLEVLINICYLFLGLLLPLMSAAVAINNLDKLKKIIQSAFDFLIIVAIPLIVGGFFTGQQLMVLMSGSQFAISGQLIKILLIATGSIFIAGLFGYVVVAIDKQKEMIKFYALNAIISIGGYIFLIQKYSYWGAAWMTVITEMFILITAAYIMKKNIGFLPNPLILYKAVLASLVMSIPLYFLNYLHFGLLVIVGAAVYLVSLYLLKGFDKKTLLEVVKSPNQN